MVRDNQSDLEKPRRDLFLNNINSLDIVTKELNIIYPSNSDLFIRIVCIIDLKVFAKLTNENLTKPVKINSKLKKMFTEYS